jgi:hypothetical protein
MTLSCEGTTETTVLHLAYSFACNLSCGHCIFRCGPNDHRTMGLRRAKRFIRQAGEAGIRKIVFTGGEPLLHPRELRNLIRHSAEQGMKSALITNAAWACSRDETKAYLADLKEIGLESITLSTDRYHLLEVPLENLRNALDASREIGLRAGVKIARLRHDPVAEGLYRSLRNSSTRVLVQEISPLGRATALRSAVKLQPAISFAGPGCLTPPVLLPDGNLLTCCNLPARDMKPTDYPLILGSAEKESLGSLLARRSRDPILEVLRSKGPGTLAALLSRREPALEGANAVPCHSACDLCFHLFSRLRDKRLLHAALRDQTRIERLSLGACL